MLSKIIEAGDLAGRSQEVPARDVLGRQSCKLVFGLADRRNRAMNSEGATTDVSSETQANYENVRPNCCDCD
jgi:hypothetical protein